MGEIDEFKQIVRNSFKNFRQHVEQLEQEINQNRKYVQEILEMIKTLKSSSTVQILPKYENQETSSIGNEGVYSLTHSLTHSPTHILNTSKDPEKVFQSLTNKEFLVFLTIFQLEKKRKVTYLEVAKHLKLSLGCIRSYISSIIQKGAPIIKTKVNNKITLLSIEKAFRTLTSEQKLVNLYYTKDPNQQNLEF